MRTYTISALLATLHSAVAVEVERLYNEDYQDFTIEDIWERFTTPPAAKPDSTTANDRVMTRNEWEAISEYFDVKYWLFDGRLMGIFDAEPELRTNYDVYVSRNKGT